MEFNMKYWAYINNEILGPYEKEKLLELPVFSASILICPQTPVGEKTGDWKEASTYPEIAALISPALPGADKQAPGGASFQDPIAGQLTPGGNFMQASASEQPAPEKTPLQTPASDQLTPVKNPEQVPVSDQLTPNRAFMTSPAAEQPAPSNPIAAPVFGQLNPGRASMPATAADQPKHGIDIPQPAANLESQHHIFSADIPESKLKPLSFHPIDQAPPAAAPHMDVMNFEVSRLGVAKDPVKKEEQQPLPTFTTSNFDPISLSQINRRAEGPAADLPKQELPKPAAAEVRPPEIFSTAVPVSPAAEASPVISVKSRTQAEPIDKKALEEINSKLETLSRNSLTKQDIEPLKEKLRQLDEAIFSIKSDQSRRELADKMQSLENSLSEIKASLAQPTAPAPVTVFNPPLPAAPPETKKPAETAKSEIVDQGSSGKVSRLARLVKKALKSLITIVLLAAVALVFASVLKRFGVIDVTKFLPFRVPFLSSPLTAETQPQPAEAPAPQPFQNAAEAKQTQAQAGQPPAAPQAEPAKKDLSDEIIFFGRTYAPKAGGTTLENKIYEDAVTRKGDFNKTSWQAKEMQSGMFELDAVIPSMDGAGQLTYSYQVDYAKKTVQAMDDASAKPLDALLKGNQPAPAKSKARVKKGRQVKQARASAKPAGKQRTKQIKGKPATPADDEYEYVYEDEAGNTEEK